MDSIKTADPVGDATRRSLSEAVARMQAKMREEGRSDEYAEGYVRAVCDGLNALSRTRLYDL